MFANPSDDNIRHLLQTVKSIAVVGFSTRPQRPSHGVARAMQQTGYRIIPVRPALTEALGERAYASITDLPAVPDLVDVFRAPQHVAGIVDECIARGVKALWLQEGVVDEAAAQRAQAAGITVIMDRCILKDYWKLMT
jgi:hypothetical protein